MMLLPKKTVFAACALGLILFSGPVRADETSSAKKVGREYFNNEINPMSSAGEDRGSPVVMGDGNVMMPGADAPRALGGTPGQQVGTATGVRMGLGEKEKEPKKVYTYDKAAHGIFSPDIMPKRLFNNVDPNR